jgi:DNA-binding transcriptional regulator YhcF (GntR family)
MARTAPDHDFLVDRDRGIPLGTQLAWRIRRLIASGRLGAGDRLPGVRDLATAAGVNVNTARSVYGRLEEQGYLRSRQGQGTFVSERPPGDPRAERVERLAADLEANAHAAGLDPHEVVAHLYGRSEGEARPSAAEGGSPGAEAESRRELRDQIAELEARLVRHPQAPREAAELSDQRRPSGSALLTSAQLRNVRNDLRSQLERAEAERAAIIQELRELEAAQAAAGRPDEAVAATRQDTPSLVGVRVRFSGTA